MKGIEIPFGAKDSELKGWEYTIPEGMEAEIKDGKIVVREKKPELTEFEQSVRDMIVKELTTEFDNKDSHITATVSLDYKTAHRLSLGLLELAKKELCKGCTVGLDQYWKGYEVALEKFEKLQTFYSPTYEPPCYHGGICTNPFKDCINCPTHSSGTTINTTSGTCKKD